MNCVEKIKSDDILILFTMPGTCSTGPHILLESLQIPYKVCLVDMDTIHKDWYHKINPLKQVGALRHGDFMLYENSAILAYIANKYCANSPVISQNHPELFGHIMHWLSFITTTVHPNFSIYYHAERYASQANINDLLKHTVERLKKNYTYVENHLKITKYLTGNDYAICDFEAYAVLRWAFDDKLFSPDDYPDIKRFLNDMANLPSIKNVTAIENKNIDTLINSRFLGYVE